MIRDLENVILLQDEYVSQLIIYVKPKNKNKVIIYDTDNSGFDVIGNELCFSFWEEDLKDFNVKLLDIKAVNVEQCDGITIAFICLRNGNTIMIHFMD